MARALIGWRNHADGAALIASSEAALLPATNLQSGHPKVPWRAAAGTAEAHLLADLGAQRPVGVVALNHADLAPPATWRIRVSASDPTGEDGGAYDSGTMPADIDWRYPKLLHLVPGAVAGRYVRIDFTIPDPNADVVSTLGVEDDELGVDGEAIGFIVTTADPLRRIGAGRLWIGPLVELSRSYSPGWKPLTATYNERYRSVGGQSWVRVQPRSRGARLTFRAITEAEALGIVEEINTEAHTARDVLIIRDPASTYLGRDTYWGLLAEPVDNQNMIARYHRVEFEIWDRQ